MDLSDKQLEKASRDNKRGITVMNMVLRAKDKGIMLEIDWNINGQPIGNMKEKFVSYIGVVTRLNVPIIYDHWKKVPEHYKEHIWDDVSSAFRVGECRQQYIYKIAGNKLRTFRTLLTGKYLKDSKKQWLVDPPMKPPALYHYIENDVWVEFVHQRYKEEFKGISSKQSSKAKKSMYPYRGSCKGYARITQELIVVESNKTGSQISQVSRAKAWKAARTSKVGTIDNEAVKIVADKIDSLIEKASQGEITDIGREDILTQALGKPDHPGSVRGVGFGVTQILYFGKQKSSKGNEEVIKEMEEKMAGLQAQMSMMAAQMASFMQAKPQIGPEDEVLQSVQASCTILLKGVSNCKLALTKPNYRIVASGKVFNTPDVKTIHNEDIPPNHARVSIDVVEESDALLPIPIKSADIMTVGMALGTMVAWPIELIIIDSTDLTGSNKSKEESTCKQAKGKKKLILTRVQGSSSNNRPKPLDLQALSMHASIRLRDGLQLIIPFDNEIMSHQYNESIGWEEIQILLDKLEIGASHVSVYLRFLWEEVVMPFRFNDHFAFLSPHSLSSVHIKSDVQVKYIALAAERKRHAQNILFLAPYNVGNHWILLGININRSLIYFMDPLGGEPSHRLDMKNTVEIALSTIAMTKGRRSVSPDWITIECPKQQNDIDCGYYVLRMMREIVVRGQIEIPKMWYDQPHRLSYSEHELDEVRSEWARFVIRFLVSMT